MNFIKKFHHHKRKKKKKQFKTQRTNNHVNDSFSECSENVEQVRLYTIFTFIDDLYTLRILLKRKITCFWRLQAGKTQEGTGLT